MKNSILLIVLTLFVSMNITACSLFSSDEEKAESATMAEGGDAGEMGDEFASDEFELGDAKGNDIEADDFDAEAMAKDEGGESPADLAGADVEVEDNFGDDYPDDSFGDAATAGTQAAAVEGMDNSFGDDDEFGDEFGDDAAGAAAATTAAADDFAEDNIDDNSFSSGDDIDDAFGDAGGKDSLAMDEGGGIPSSTMTANEEEDLFGADSLGPVIDTPSYTDTTSYSGYDSYGDSGNSGLVSVKKMKPAAYKRSGGNVNRLYVVRPGDNMDSIAEKIYGSSAQAEKLYGFNSHHRGRTLNVGDKVYYESPNNPRDTSMLTYYEDNNVAPSYYTSQEGDNIRKVAKKLLGHDRSWMELYATNENIESKGRIPAGLQVRYWPDGSAPQTLAMNDPEPAPTMPDPTFDEPATIEEPENLPTEEPVAIDEPTEIKDPSMDEPSEMANLDDPASLDDPDEVTPPPTVGNTGNPTAPPPMAKQPVAPPPAPPVAGPKPLNKPMPPKVGGAADDPLAAISGDDNMIMGALGGLLLLAAIIMLIFIRRSRAKRVNFSQTQV